MKRISILFILFTLILSSCEKDEPKSSIFTDSRDGQEYKWIEIGD